MATSESSTERNLSMNGVVSTISELAAAIAECRDTRANVYKADPDQIQVHAHGAREVARDHIARVVYELLQNAEDAGSDSFVVHLQTDPPTAYFCDNGQGIAPSAIKSLSSLFLSPKKSGIGRKGIGFKAVYSVCAQPIVITGTDAVVFDKRAARDWMNDRGMASEDVPYQWLPFWRSRTQVFEELRIPMSLAQFTTIVALGLKDIASLKGIARDCQELESTSLLTFRNVRRLAVHSDDQPFEILVKVLDDGSVALEDSRNEGSSLWRLHRAALTVPQEIVATFEPDERSRYQSAEVLLGVQESGCGAIKEATNRPNLLVYYPTGHPAPSDFLTHADFLVSSDRARVADPASNQYNGWLGERLAVETITFANSLISRNPGNSSAVIARLGAEKANDTVVRYVRDRLKSEAGRQLQVRNAAGNYISPSECVLLKCTAPSTARAFARTTSIDPRLVAKSIDESDSARLALVQFGSREMDDLQLLDVAKSDIENGDVADVKVAVPLWRWARATDEAGKTFPLSRLAFATALKDSPILPADDRWVTPRQVESVPFALCAAPEKGDAHIQVSYCRADVLQDLLASEDHEGLSTFLFGLGVDKDLTVARTKALHIYHVNWKGLPREQKNDDGLFLRLIAQWKLFELPRPATLLGSVPVPVHLDGEKVRWVQAFEAYRVRGSNAKLMAILIGDKARVPRVSMRKVQSLGADEQVLDWLGCPTRPQVVLKIGEQDLEAERKRAEATLSENGRFLLLDVGSPKALNSIAIDTLSDDQFSALLALLAGDWDEYYKHHATKTVRYFYRIHRESTIDEPWWQQVKRRNVRTSVPDCVQPFEQCRVIQSGSLQSFHSFVPEPELPGLSKVKRDEVRKWMQDGLRQAFHLDKLTWIDWERILETFIPKVWLASEKSERTARPIRDVYRAYLRLCAQRAPPQRPKRILVNWTHGQLGIVDSSSVPVYVNDEPRLAERCPPAVALFECQEGLRAQAKRVFGLESLSDTIKHAKRRALDIDDPVLKHVNAGLIAGRPLLLALLQAKRCESTIEELKSRLDAINVEEVGALEFSAIVRTTAGPEEVTFSRTAVSDKSTVFVLSRAEDSLGLVFTHAAREIARLLQLTEYGRVVEAILSREDRRTALGLLADAGVSRDGISEAEAIYIDSGAPIQNPRGVKPPLAPSEAFATGVASKTDGAAANAESLKPREPSAVDDPVVCKDGASAPYRHQRSLPTHQPRGDAPAPRTLGRDIARAVISEPSQTDKRKIESESRVICMRALKKLGFSAEEMDWNNAGYDIRAIKDRRELRVEVKGHLRACAVVTLTRNEFEMSLAAATAESEFDWELWNVENLDGSADEILLTRFARIPAEAVTCETYSVTLSQCVLKPD